MKVSVSAESLRRTTVGQYAVRFAFGGAITALAGIIANKWGPAVGGLFLAFPAVCPASLTLVESHERQKDHDGESARKSAGVDAAGAAIASVGLAAFAAVIWAGAERLGTVALLAVATVVWTAVSAVVWAVRQKL